MTLSVKHLPVLGPNDPTKQVSKTIYEQEHDLTGFGTAAAADILDFDAVGVAAAAVVTHVALPDPHAQYALELSLAAVATSGLKADVGLGNVDNTSDAAKPVSTATQTALNLKANLAGPTFTGTVGGISATMVGLGSVTNDAQTKAAIVPNTAPSAGQVLVGNAGGTAYAPVTMGTDATLSSAGALTIAAGAVTEAKMTLADNTTNDVSTTKHGFTPKAPNDTTKFFRGDATYAVPTAADPSYSPGSFTVATETGRLVINHLKLTGAQRATIAGTGRLKVSN